MQRLKLVGLTIALLILVLVQSAFAHWYAGNKRNDAYGVKARIHVPSSPPYLLESGSSGQSSWVSTQGPYWIQAGWRYYWWYSEPIAYIESCQSPCAGSDDYDLTEFGTQSWNFSRLQGKAHRRC